jgi:hypothetical protein
MREPVHIIGAPRGHRRCYKSTDVRTLTPYVCECSARFETVRALAEHVDVRAKLYAGVLK